MISGVRRIRSRCLNHLGADVQRCTARVFSAHLRGTSSTSQGHPSLILSCCIVSLALTEDQIKEADAYAYGGSAIQDVGHYPFGSSQFGDLVHYVPIGDFVIELLQGRQ
jgi:hypothetical protein